MYKNLKKNILIVLAGYIVSYYLVIETLSRVMNYLNENNPEQSFILYILTSIVYFILFMLYLPIMFIRYIIYGIPMETLIQYGACTILIMIIIPIFANILRVNKGE